MPVSDSLKAELKQRFEAAKTPAESCDLGNALAAIQLFEKLGTAVESTQEKYRWEFKFAPREKEAESQSAKNPLSEESTCVIVNELWNRKIKELEQAKESWWPGRGVHRIHSILTELHDLTAMLDRSI